MNDIRTREQQEQQTEAGNARGQSQTGGKAAGTGSTSLFARPLFWIIIIILLALLAGGGYVWANPSVMSSLTDTTESPMNGMEGDAAVATVNGNDITASELNERVEQALSQTSQEVSDQQRQQLRQQTLRNLVNRELLLQEAQSAGISVSDDQVQQRVQQVQNQLGTSTSFQDALDQRGLTEDAFRQQLRDQLTIQQLLEQNVNTDNISVSDEEVQQLYTQLSQGQQGDNIPALEQVRPQLENRVRQQKTSQQQQQYLQQLRNNADVQINLSTSTSSQ